MEHILSLSANPVSVNLYKVSTTKYKIPLLIKKL